jgi:hypothetical protein
LPFLIATGCSSAMDGVGASRYRKALLDDGPLCVDKRLQYRIERIAGLLGTRLGGRTQGLLISLPMEGAAGEAGELGIFLRTAIGESTHAIPRVDATNATRSSESPEILILPRTKKPALSETLVGPTVSELIGQFVAVCDGAPTMELCSRRFEFEGLEGSYAFKREDLAQWREMEGVLVNALVEKDVSACSR